MTLDEILVLARTHLSTDQRGQLAGHLIKDLGLPKFIKVPPTTSIMGSPSWTEEELHVLRMLTQMVVAKLEGTPPEFSRAAVTHIQSLIAPYLGNKA
ncbi:MAG: hypothetical protein KIT31_18630 [Deltaproteobacteria bacterium]|nr:hypothetical protein [Deltaproteobacteria bacterium]